MFATRFGVTHGAKSEDHIRLLTPKFRTQKGKRRNWSAPMHWEAERCKQSKAKNQNMKRQVVLKRVIGRATIRRKMPKEYEDQKCSRSYSLSSPSVRVRFPSLLMQVTSYSMTSWYRAINFAPYHKNDEYMFCIPLRKACIALHAAPPHQTVLTVGYFILGNTEHRKQRSAWRCRPHHCFLLFVWLDCLILNSWHVFKNSLRDARLE